MTEKNLCIVYGGAFNPPTINHQKVLQACVDRAARSGEGNQVWLLPSGENNKKKTGLSADVRMTYCERLIESIDQRNVAVRTERLELDDTKPTDKIETAQRLMAAHSMLRFEWVYGIDSFKTIDSWGGEWLKAHTDMLVVPRDGEVATELSARATYLYAETVDNISSTLVRDKIREREDVKEFVPGSVYESIDPELYIDKT